VLSTLPLQDTTPPGRRSRASKREPRLARCGAVDGPKASPTSPPLAAARRDARIALKQRRVKTPHMLREANHVKLRTAHKIV